eukprot:SAG31_NODE_5052_length_2774_cov_1.392150_2_plen_231_part_00
MWGVNASTSTVTSPGTEVSGQKLKHLEALLKARRATESATGLPTSDSDGNNKPYAVTVAQKSLRRVDQLDDRVSPVTVAANSDSSISSNSAKEQLLRLQRARNHTAVRTPILVPPPPPPRPPPQLRIRAFDLEFTGPPGPTGIVVRQKTGSDGQQLAEVVDILAGSDASFHPEIQPGLVLTAVRTRSPPLAPELNALLAGDAQRPLRLEFREPEYFTQPPQSNARHLEVG